MSSPRDIGVYGKPEEQDANLQYQIEELEKDVLHMEF
eukprot:CAMPEP_0197656910 /NCGR_PEP_ID=MMETSP1338-20131121/43934_1 /TAXON_ID=43686 ORGANISM="Pelagodinium beii, Strain RCC1491" /NCGR_SAMPLE_ID=MMETSP1338 /ASSEMBLY_ACC=CAM_ASM_000754 /LENGTH=36 /DNA_ID= /DNA_START= /DNA_END= /DNA_ORIENTATION=